MHLTLISTFSILFFLSCESHLGFKNSMVPRKLSILQTSTDSTSTTIRVVYPKFLKLNFEVLEIKTNIMTKIENKSITSSTYSRPYSEFSITHLQIKDLKEGMNYKLNLTSQYQNWSDERTFKTYKKKNSFNMIVASCLSDQYLDKATIMWKKIEHIRPDVISLIGDNIYADVFSGVYLGNLVTVTPEHLWKRHVDSAMSLPIFFQENLVPTYTIWDDHDMGENNGNSTYKYLKESQEIFRIFFPVDENKFIKKGPGLAFSYHNPLMSSLYLDARSFRGLENDKSGSHLGISQLKWIEDSLNYNDKNTFIFKGDQFFGAYHSYESYEGNHPKEFKVFISIIDKQKSPPIFLSGDRHLVEVMKIEDVFTHFNPYEITLSGLHAIMFPGSLKREQNPRRMDGFDGLSNFGLFEIFPNNQIKYSGFSNLKAEHTHLIPR